MARRLDQILVIDIEATCWDGAPPEGQAHDIIEIGLCPIDIATGERLERVSMLVRPERSTVSRYCTDLTTLTQEQVTQGIAFAEACARLKSEYQSKDRLWASYGDYDRKQFERQCLEMGVPYPFGPGHLNVKTLAAVLLALRHEVGMDEALERFHLPLEGTHHRAVDDAWNIAGILSRMLLQWRRE